MCRLLWRFHTGPAGQRNDIEDGYENSNDDIPNQFECAKDHSDDASEDPQNNLPDNDDNTCD